MKPAGDPHLTSSAEPPAGGAGDADLSGKILGDFQILRRLGQGGMGQVYLAEQISLKRKVALKVLKPDLAANANALARFKLEAEAVARATHANIVQVYAINEVNGLHYMALEYIEGRNLRQYLEKKGPPEVLVALSIIRQVSSALQRASELGIIHRDIKPENILLTRKTEVKVADFGLSRCFADDAQPLNITASGVTMGTPLYMSPEQVEGKPVDPRTDIYSFGVTCYHMLAGHPPYRGKTAFEVAVQHVQGEPQPLAMIRPDLPPELCALIHKMMARRPEDRFQTGREIVREVGRLRDALVGVTGGQPTHTMTMSAAGATDQYNVATTQPVPTYRPRRWLPLLAVASVFLALGGGLGYGWWMNQGQPQTTANTLPPEGKEEPPGEKTLFSNKEREKSLIEAIKLHAQPKTLKEAQRGLDDRIDLGLLYLKERRLKEADDFFKQLEAQGNVRDYQLLGRMGHAMTLAFQNQTKKSNDLFKDLFVELFKEKKGPLKSQAWWWNNPPLREMLAESLHFNYTNSPRTFPVLLEKLRHPPTPKLKVG